MNLPPKIIRQATAEQVAEAFTEWDRRWREEPERFESDCVRLLRGETPEEYGEACSPYFLEILEEIAGTAVIEHREARA